MGRHRDSPDDDADAAPPSVPKRLTRNEEEATLASNGDSKSTLSSLTEATDKKPKPREEQDNKLSREELKVKQFEETTALAVGRSAMTAASSNEQADNDEQDRKPSTREELKLRQFDETTALAIGLSSASAADTSVPGAHSSVASPPEKGLSMAAGSNTAGRSRRLDDDDIIMTEEDAKAMDGKPLSAGFKLGAHAIGGPELLEVEEEIDVPTSQHVAGYSAGPDMTPIAAEVVLQPQADVEAQAQDIENRLREELFKHTVSAQVVDGSERKEEEDERKKKRKCYIIGGVVLLLLVVGGVVGAVVGVTSGGGGGSTPTMPPAPSSNPTTSRPSSSPSIFVQPCTLCQDGSEANLQAEVSRGKTCGDLESDLAQLGDSQDAVCLSGQAQGWYSCSCPTLPRRPATFVCTAACREDSRPPAWDSQECRDFETFVELVALVPEECDGLIARTPEACRCSTEIDDLREIMKTVSDERDLFDTTTPQYKAIRWLANDDPADLTIGATRAGVLQMRYFGALLWFSLGGQNWNAQFGFRNATGVCDWNDGDSGIFCDDSNIFTSIVMEDNTLIGTFPSTELTAFDSFEVLRFANNDIRGTIPAAISNLANLRIFVMDSNLGFGGKLPSGLFELPRLSQLWLDNCDLEGFLPNNIGAATSLTSLAIQRSGLTGSIPTSISLLAAMDFLLLNNNALIGKLPDVSKMLSLQEFFLYNNNLDGTIPAHYGQLPRLKRLGLHVNKLEGTIPDFSQNNALEYLYLYDNSLNGNIAPAFTTTPPTLIELSLDSNELSGSIPPIIGRFQALDGLWLLDNPRLTGTLPTEIGLLTGMTKIFDIDSTGIFGTIPTEIGQLVNIREIDLSICGFTGRLPSELGLMTSLTVFDVNSNMLTGMIPTELANCQDMNLISFASNRFTGTVPTELATPPNLELFLVQGNELSGDLVPFCDAGLEIRADCAFPPEILCDCCETCL